ncbi:hypothetical protein CS542_07600 [Pedobacter sp. IW39]|nr:hypothetical protein CS542_07600 [Pedobacter sp. IW39]
MRSTRMDQVHTEQEQKSIFELGAIEALVEQSLSQKIKVPIPACHFHSSFGQQKVQFRYRWRDHFRILQDDQSNSTDCSGSINFLNGTENKKYLKGLLPPMRNDTVLKMRSWCCDYIGDDFHTHLADEIPTLEGTDLIIRPDYFERQVSLQNTPIYHTETMHEKEKWQA